MTSQFPAGFLWGAATAPHQVEGGNVNADLWPQEWAPGSHFAEPSGDACDHYHRYPEDIAIVRPYREALRPPARRDRPHRQAPLRDAGPGQRAHLFRLHRIP